MSSFEYSPENSPSRSTLKSRARKLKSKVTVLVFDFQLCSKWYEALVRSSKKDMETIFSKSLLGQI